VASNGHLARRLDALEGELLNLRFERELGHTALHLASRRGWTLETTVARLRALVAQLKASFGDDVETARRTLAVERGLDFDAADGIVAEVWSCPDREHSEEL
jgi:hypothetical protein